MSAPHCPTAPSPRHPLRQRSPKRPSRHLSGGAWKCRSLRAAQRHMSAQCRRANRRLGAHEGRVGGRID
eukprot:scaffold84408_cov33-Tisochrysis_lutea.AAC.5